MTLEPAQLVDAWPLGASLAAAVAQGLFVGRRRTALNEALHEVRRPLQALALIPPAASAERALAIDGAVRMAAIALERLECEINGGEIDAGREQIIVHELLTAATRRWQARARLGGAELSLRSGAEPATVAGDRGELARALDNLIVNAIEHGGPEIVVSARLAAARVELVVADSGRGSPPTSRHQGPARLIARLNGRRRHGHGLRVVRRAAAAHGGDFRLHRSAAGTEAVLELPLPMEGRR